MGVALCGDAPRDPWAGGLGSEASFLLVPWGQGHPRGTQSVGLGRPLAEGRCWAPLLHPLKGHSRGLPGTSSVSPLSGPCWGSQSQAGVSLFQGASSVSGAVTRVGSSGLGPCFLSFLAQMCAQAFLEKGQQPQAVLGGVKAVVSVFIPHSGGKEASWTC